jgi:hypothetical protein
MSVSLHGFDAGIIENPFAAGQRFATTWRKRGVKRGFSGANGRIPEWRDHWHARLRGPVGKSLAHAANLLSPHASCTPIYGAPGARSMRLPGVPVEKLRFVASYDESLFFNKFEELIY